ncbi:MAG: hypothetical protein Q7R62_01550 [bacterium]|nr:hypothetical protein [bacterium]
MGFIDFKNERDFMEKSGYTIDGLWYPRVTKIVDIKAKPALYQFYGQVGFENGKAISQRSAEEGTAVHEAVEKIMIGQKPGDMLSQIVPAVRAFLEFIKTVKIKVNPEHVERRIINPEHRYAGTIDTMATIDGRFGVLDIKTSEAVYRDYNIQTSAYMDALTREFKDLTTRWILRIDQIQNCKNCGSTRRNKGGREKIKRNGTVPCYGGEHDWNEPKGVIELKEIETPWQDDFNAFLGAKKLWEWEHAEWLKKIGYIKE